MKTCAYCGGENEDQAMACSGCGTKFETAPEPVFEDPDLTDPGLAPVVVATFRNLPEASFLVERLQEAGIEAWLPEEFGQVFSGVIALDPITVRVTAKDLEAAKGVIEEIRATAIVPGPSNSSVPGQIEGSSGQLNLNQPAKPSEPGTQKLCVACSKVIPANAVLCPICGWTQPS